MKSSDTLKAKIHYKGMQSSKGKYITNYATNNTVQLIARGVEDTVSCLGGAGAVFGRYLGGAGAVLGRCWGGARQTGGGGTNSRCLAGIGV